MRATIAVLPGDGIGPEVTSATLRVLTAVATTFGHDFLYEEALIGGAAIDAAGTPLPDDTISICRGADATLLGAVGGPNWDSLTANVRPEQGLLGIRRALQLYANIRPVAPYAQLAAASPLKPELLRDVDLVVVRELTGGIYFGAKSRKHSEHGVVARDVCTYSEEEIERVTRIACTLARARRGRVTSVDKANVLETSRLWRQVVTRVVRDEYRDVTLDHMLVDACAMHLITRPSSFDVILTENMFGDILTDEASVLAGSIGLLPSASLGVETGSKRRGGLYEPIHGSAPTIAGKGIANPIGAILSASMLLRWSLGLPDEADAVDRAVAQTIDNGVLTVDVAASPERASSTVAVAEAVCERVANAVTPLSGVA
jgi:3-isopropylmalate dehydrogenase